MKANTIYSLWLINEIMNFPGHPLKSVAKLEFQTLLSQLLDHIL